MATETTVPIDDKGMLSDIMSPEPAAPVEATPEPVATPEQPRDESGRFATKPAEPELKADTLSTPVEAATPPVLPEAKDDTGQVPSWRLRELREAREAAERRATEAGNQAYAVQQQLQAMQRELAALKQPKQEPVDFFANPDAAVDQRLTPIMERFENMERQVRLNSSRAVAIATHGAKAVSEMENAIEQASRSNHPDLPSLAQQMRGSDDPVNVAMQWHRRNKMMEVTGGDPEAYRQKVLDEAMKDPAFQAKVLETARGQAQQQPNARPNIQLPPSLSKAVGAANPSAATDEADMSERGIFKFALGK